MLWNLWIGPGIAHSRVEQDNVALNDAWKKIIGYVSYGKRISWIIDDDAIWRGCMLARFTPNIREILVSSNYDHHQQHNRYQIFVEIEI